jgi:hypothetical protein
MKGRNAIKGIPKSPWNLASITTAPVAKRKKKPLYAKKETVILIGLVFCQQIENREPWVF